jgi:hypothetical protein
VRTTRKHSAHSEEGETAKREGGERAYSIDRSEKERTDGTDTHIATNETTSERESERANQREKMSSGARKGRRERRTEKKRKRMDVRIKAPAGRAVQRRSS